MIVIENLEQKINDDLILYEQKMEIKGKAHRNKKINGLNAIAIKDLITVKVSIEYFNELLEKDNYKIILSKENWYWQEKSLNQREYYRIIELINTYFAYRRYPKTQLVNAIQNLLNKYSKFDDGMIAPIVEWVKASKVNVVSYERHINRAINMIETVHYVGLQVKNKQIWQFNRYFSTTNNTSGISDSFKFIADESQILKLIGNEFDFGGVNLIGHGAIYKRGIFEKDDFTMVTDDYNTIIRSDYNHAKIIFRNLL